MTITCSTCGVWTLDDSYKKISAGRWVTYDPFADDAGTLWVWGSPLGGVQGTGVPPGFSSSPIQLPGNQWVHIVNNQLEGFALKADNTLWAWGNDNQGNLGLNTYSIPRSSPTQISGTSIASVGDRWVCVDIGVSAARTRLALGTNGTLWSWGQSYQGVSGLLVSSGYCSRPTQIPGVQWCSVRAAGRGSAAVKRDGTLWYWGYASVNGEGTATARSSPTQIPGTQWSDVGGNYCTLAARKTDGTVWFWGGNGGSFGNNDTIPTNSPTQTPGTWISLRTGVGLKSDGTLWTWGNNSQGQLGLNDVINRSSPVQVPGTQWLRYCRTGIFALATKTDGTLWSWGYNAQAQLGNNSTIPRSSPVQIPGTQWNRISAGDRHGYATKRP